MEEKVSMKRKRVQTQLTSEERESRLKTLNDELNSLFNYFNEVLNSDITSSLCLFKDNVNLNAAIAALLEEKRCSYSKLADEIYEKVKDRDGGITIGNVKASVLFVGQRISYGVANGDVDVLEDESDSCLWCWETRDMKLLPSSLRGIVKIRRIGRKKISERITAVQDVITSLNKYEDDLSCKHSMTKVTEKLRKALSEADIRMLVESLTQKNDSEMAEKEAKKTGTSLVKELEKNKLKAEKEKKRMDRELQKEKLQSEKERKRMQHEAEKEEKRREKEDSEMRKHLKRKQEEAEKEQRQKEKEEAELKKQLAVQKQASIMERFLKKRRTTSTSQNDQSTGIATSVSNADQRENTNESVSVMMDSALQHSNDIDVQEIRKCHLNAWRLVGHSVRSNKHRWGTRSKPKTQLIKELKLTSNNEPTGDDDLCVDGLVDRQGEMCGDDRLCHDHPSVSSQGTRKCLRRKQLLQFDKSNRPAFYGIWPKKSHVVGFRHPLKKDPDLDYEIDSDEEWEEEEPGESLSDSEKEDEEILDGGSCKGDDEEENEDGFFVPDGYLSESEGVENDRSQTDFGAEVMNSSPSRKVEAESEECSSWTRQQKYLRNLTENALRKNQPLVIVNLMHEKIELLSAEDLSGTQKVEQMCLQALSIIAFPGGSCIELPDTNLHEENHYVSSFNSNSSPAAATTIPDFDLPKIVSVIQSCAQGMSRLLEALQKCFPDISKALLKNKVREISDYDPVVNRWKVKKDILGNLGMTTPEKTKLGTKSIATFFSKRCLPPARHVVNIFESSPEPMKLGSSSQQPHESTKDV